MRFFRPLDTMVILLICATTVVSFMQFKGQGGSRAEIYLENRKTASFDLKGPKRIKEIGSRIGKIRIEVGNNAIRVLDSPCNQKICILQGEIKETHEHIICLPARMSISIASDKPGNNPFDAVDAFSY